MKKKFVFLMASIVFTNSHAQNIERIKVDRKHSLSPEVLITSKHANRNVLRSLFLCNCAGSKSQYDDYSSALYFDLLSNYSQDALDFFLTYTRNYISNANENDRKFMFAACMRHYNSREFNKIVADLDSALYLNRYKKEKIGKN
ncbi:hypothetical protein [Hymenobacter rubripertinctus]|uniref:hypothetical protein n=1 Tax=Hymenobacter rubripertinctus TaxID=2029981 RepID=UPI0011C383E3|nr:hypothetical protein [Hymenobacter rubripertinctus]